MKIKVKEILRGPDLTANPNDIIIVDDIIGNKLIKADAAEEIIEISEEDKTVVIEPENAKTSSNTVKKK